MHKVYLIFIKLFLVTDISDLEQRIRDLPIHTEEADNADIISIGSEDSTEPSDFRPWENHADRALLPSCKKHNIIVDSLYNFRLLKGN